jgi:hypothetical protein
MPVSPAIAARDAEIFAAAEQLRVVLGREPLRKELAEHVADTTGESCSAGRVSQAYRRRKDAEGDTAPGTGGRKKAPLLDDVIDLCKGAIEVAREFDGLPRKELVGPAGRLRRRKGWEQQLRELTEPPPAPEQLELDLDLDIPAVLARDVALLQKWIDESKDPATARPFLDLQLKAVEKLEKFRPAPERDGKRLVDAEAIGSYGPETLAKLRQLTARLAAEQEAKRQAIMGQGRTEGLMVWQTETMLRRLGLLPPTEESTT